MNSPSSTSTCSPFWTRCLAGAQRYRAHAPRPFAPARDQRAARFVASVLGRSRCSWRQAARHWFGPRVALARPGGRCWLHSAAIEAGPLRPRRSTLHYSATGRSRIVTNYFLAFGLLRACWPAWPGAPGVHLQYFAWHEQPRGRRSRLGEADLMLGSIRRCPAHRHEPAFRSTASSSVAPRGHPRVHGKDAAVVGTRARARASRRTNPTGRGSFD